MSCCYLVAPFSDDDTATATHGFLLLLLLAVFLAVSGSLLLVAWSADMAVPASAPADGDARTSTEAHGALPGAASPPVSEMTNTGGGRPVPESAASSALDTGSKCDPGRLALATLRDPDTWFFTVGSRPDANGRTKPPDLRQDLALMAARQRRTGFVYVGPR